MTAPLAQLFPGLTAYADALRARPGLEGVTVLDGPSISQTFPGECIAVGVVPPTEGVAPSARVSRTGPNGLLPADREVATATCAVSIVNGAGDFAAARARAAALFAEAADVLMKDPKLGGTCHHARIGDWAYWPLATEHGAEALITWDVVISSQLGGRT